MGEEGFAKAMQDTLLEYDNFGKMHRDLSIKSDVFGLKQERPDFIKNVADREDFLRNAMLVEDFNKVSTLARKDPVFQKVFAERSGEMSNQQLTSLLNKHYSAGDVPESIVEAVVLKKSGEDLDRLMRFLPEKIKNKFKEAEIPLPNFKTMVEQKQLSAENVRIDQLEKPDFAQVVAQFGSVELKQDITKDAGKLGAFKKAFRISEKPVLTYQKARG